MNILPIWLAQMDQLLCLYNNVQPRLNFNTHLLPQCLEWWGDGCCTIPLLLFCDVLELVHPYFPVCLWTPEHLVPEGLNPVAALVLKALILDWITSLVFLVLQFARWWMWDFSASKIAWASLYNIFSLVCLSMLWTSYALVFKVSIFVA